MLRRPPAVIRPDGQEVTDIHDESAGDGRDLAPFVSSLIENFQSTDVILKRIVKLPQSLCRALAVLPRKRWRQYRRIVVGGEIGNMLITEGCEEGVLQS